MKRRGLSLCTGNSCRSQMAEAIVNARIGDRWEAVSAGSRPAGFVDPRTITVPAEIGIRHKGRAKNAGEFRGMAFDLVVTACDTAAEECPVWLGKGKRVHAGFPDPASGGLDGFRRVRDDIARRVVQLLDEQSRGQA
ncbi:MAG: arsenate reductase ArsC [Anaerolineales bacterium]|nr:arsenate reductase ArsC [Anaerolineales bacterium]